MRWKREIILIVIFLIMLVIGILVAQEISGKEDLGKLEIDIDREEVYDKIIDREDK